MNFAKILSSVFGDEEKPSPKKSKAGFVQEIENVPASQSSVLPKELIPKELMPRNPPHEPSQLWNGVPNTGGGME